ncbi:exodeoxyribonuclease VII small subunit [Candidatus Saccharibacteria bacterium]|nr:exodeoxyribonuclease VII small subunit [Candidatus Saccharibacteria bacterium]
MVKELSLNQKIEKLDAEVEWFYSDEFKLEDAVEKYKGAAELANSIKDDLEKLKNEIQVLSEDFSKK